MPQSPARPCRHPGCRAITRSGLCPDHAEVANRRMAERWSVADSRRGTASARGYGARWQRYRVAFLSQYPWCGNTPTDSRQLAYGCMSKGIVTAASVVDHIVPAAERPDLFWLPSNHQALCKACHDTKTRTEQASPARRKRKI